MNMISMIENRRCDALVDALRAEFGGILAERILEAEAIDFLWEGRVAERYLGQQAACFLEDEACQELSRMLVLSRLGERWMVGLCLVDGDGNAADLLWKQAFASRGVAELAFVQAH